MRNSNRKEKFNVALMVSFTLLLLIQMLLCIVTPTVTHISHVSSLVCQYWISCQLGQTLRSTERKQLHYFTFTRRKIWVYQQYSASDHRVCQ